MAITGGKLCGKFDFYITFLNFKSPIEASGFEIRSPWVSGRVLTCSLTRIRKYIHIHYPFSLCMLRTSFNIGPVCFEISDQLPVDSSWTRLISNHHTRQKCIVVIIFTFHRHEIIHTYRQLCTTYILYRSYTLLFTNTATFTLFLLCRHMKCEDIR